MNNLKEDKMKSTTTLMNAAYNDQLKMVQYLVKGGADVDIIDKGGLLCESLDS